MGVPRPSGRTRAAEVGAEAERGASGASPETWSRSRARGERSEPRDPERTSRGERSEPREGRAERAPRPGGNTWVATRAHTRGSHITRTHTEKPPLSQGFPMIFSMCFSEIALRYYCTAVYTAPGCALIRNIPRDRTRVCIA